MTPEERLRAAGWLVAAGWKSEPGGMRWAPSFFTTSTMSTATAIGVQDAIEAAERRGWLKEGLKEARKSYEAGWQDAQDDAQQDAADSLREGHLAGMEQAARICEEQADRDSIHTTRRGPYESCARAIRKAMEEMES